MLGRGDLPMPDLAWQIRAAVAGRAVVPLGWEALLLPMLLALPRRGSQDQRAATLPGRLKQWLIISAAPIIRRQATAPATAPRNHIADGDERWNNMPATPGGGMVLMPFRNRRV